MRIKAGKGSGTVDEDDYPPTRCFTSLSACFR